MPGDEVLLEVRGRVARITLNRPEVLNAENMAWIEALQRAVDAAREDAQVRVVVVRGAGRSFCSGMDRDMLAAEGMPEGFYAAQERAFRGLETMGKITIAAIHGHCLGGGLQLAIACDLRICSTEGRLGVPALGEGLFPGMAVFRLPRLIGLGPARRLILSGEPVDGAEAHRLGLVDHLVPVARFDEGVEEVVTRYEAAPPTATSAAKLLMSESFTSSFERVFGQSEALLRECLASPEAAEAGEEWRQRRLTARFGSRSAPVAN